MPNMWYATGPEANLLRRAKSITPNPAADANFPASNLYDGRPGIVFRWGSIGADSLLPVDLQGLTNGDMEGGFGSGVPTAWTKVGSGTTADETTIKHGGAHAVSIDAGQTYLKQVVACRPGQYRKFTAWIRMAVAATRAGDLFVFNPITGRYHNGTTWVGSQTPFATLAATISFTQVGGTFQVEDLAACGFADTVPIEHWIEAPAAGSGLVYFDDVEAFPGVNLSAVFGHNADPLLTVTLDSSDDSSSWTTRATPAQPLPRPSFYSLVSMTYARYWRLRFLGSNSSQSGTIYLGEWVLAQAVQALRYFDAPFRLRYKKVLARHATGAGSVWSYQVGGRPVWSTVLEFSTPGAWPNVQWKQLREELYERSRGGADPVIVIPKDDDPTLAFYGWLASELEVSGPHLNQADTKIELVPEPMPVLVS